jgi:sugar (pentulose or hexulose) kinase
MRPAADIRHVAVIDIGKTNAKVVLVDLDALAEVASHRTANRPRHDGPYPHHDVDALWSFILDGLARLRGEQPVDAICVTTHGATAALLGKDGRLALPVLDYEHDGPDSLRAGYDAVRPSFEETGSPPLPLGLNLGAQLFWQERSFPEAFDRTTSILTYPQYWAWRLCGVAASEVTSLGCHTDLWNPYAGDFSSLVENQGWRGRFPPRYAAGDRLGTLLPDVAALTGLDPSTPVLCGIHDSNASLLPHLMARSAPFAVVSTGTWVVSMAVGATAKALDPARDTLVNVDAFGGAVPSARFMGGREFEMVTGGEDTVPSDGEVDAVLADLVTILPAVQPGSGPFPGMITRHAGREPKTRGETAAAASFYLAMMTATCLDLIGARGPTVVEGPFAKNRAFAAMLSAATGRSVLADAGRGTGTSVGAALLAVGGRTPDLTPPVEVGASAGWADYAAHWRTAVG